MLVLTEPMLTFCGSLDDPSAEHCRTAGRSSSSWSGGERRRTRNKSSLAMEPEIAHYPTRSAFEWRLDFGVGSEEKTSPDFFSGSCPVIVPCVRLENVYAGQALAESKYTPTESCCSVRSSAPAHFRSAPLSTSQYIARVHCHRQKLSLRKGCSSSLVVRTCPALLEAVYTRPPRRHRLGRPQLRRRRQNALKQPRKVVATTCSRSYGLAGDRHRPGCCTGGRRGKNSISPRRRETQCSSTA